MSFPNSYPKLLSQATSIRQQSFPVKSHEWITGAAHQQLFTGHYIQTQ
jgi:hypothetical protein